MVAGIRAPWIMPGEQHLAMDVMSAHAPLMMYHQQQQQRQDNSEGMPQQAVLSLPPISTLAAAITHSQNNTERPPSPPLTEEQKAKDLFSQRKQREFIPDNKKDRCYWDRRQRNNEAAKRSREKRRFNDMILEQRVVELSKENHILKSQLNAYKEKFGINEDVMLQQPEIMNSLPSTEQVIQLARQRSRIFRPGFVALSPGGGGQLPSLHLSPKSTDSLSPQSSPHSITHSPLRDEAALNGGYPIAQLPCIRPISPATTAHPEYYNHENNNPLFHHNYSNEHETEEMEEDPKTFENEEGEEEEEEEEEALNLCRPDKKDTRMVTSEEQSPALPLKFRHKTHASPAEKDIMEPAKVDPSSCRSSDSGQGTDNDDNADSGADDRDNTPSPDCVNKRQRLLNSESPPTNFADQGFSENTDPEDMRTQLRRLASEVQTLKNLLSDNNQPTRFEAPCKPEPAV